MRRRRVPSFTADWPRPLRIAAAIVFLLAAPLWVWALVSLAAPERAAAQWEEWMATVREIWTGLGYKEDA